MLRDLYVAAWVKSAEPVPDWHDEHPTDPKTVHDSSPKPLSSPKGLN
jgi:hypothetical protein